MPAFQTITRIRAAALRLFVERGIDAVSVRDIAATADVMPSTLYVHWKSRDQLVADLFRTGFAGYAQRLSRIVALPASFRLRLTALVHEVCGLHDEDTQLFQFLLLTQHVNLPAVTDDGENPIAVVAGFVADARRAGEISEGDPMLLTAAIVGIVVQAATFRHYGRLTGTLGERSGELVGLCLKLVQA